MQLAVLFLDVDVILSTHLLRTKYIIYNAYICTKIHSSEELT